MGSHAELSFGAEPLLKLFTEDFLVGFLVPVLQIEIPVILSACTPQSTESTLIQQAGFRSFIERAPQLFLMMSKTTTKLLFAISAKRAHFCLIWGLLRLLRWLRLSNILVPWHLRLFRLTRLLRRRAPSFLMCQNLHWVDFERLLVGGVLEVEGSVFLGHTIIIIWRPSTSSRCTPIST